MPKYGKSGTVLLKFENIEKLCNHQIKLNHTLPTSHHLWKLNIIGLIKPKFPIISIINYDDELGRIQDLICSNTICTIAADEKSPDTVWFVYVVDSECINDGRNDYKDIYGHSVPSNQPLQKRCDISEK